jgi:hypothetical protein
MADKKRPLKMQRVTLYLSIREYRLLKSKLALLGMSVSEWVRREIMRFIGEDE